MGDYGIATTEPVFSFLMAKMHRWSNS